MVNKLGLCICSNLVFGLAITSAVVIFIIAILTDTDPIEDRTPLAMALFIIGVISSAIIAIGIIPGLGNENDQND